jgi:TPP-dependent pyruvate/acetoin dehydrogenase alpha subunit
VAAWEARDPIERWRRYLVGRNLWSQELHDRYAAEIQQEIAAALEHAESVGPPMLASLFDDVYAELPPHLREQREECLAGPRAKSGHGGH